MFSLCVPTMDRYDNFISKNLIHYLDNELINEIIITDENGNDINKIILNFKNHDNFKKIFTVKNEKQLGPFLNKYKACMIAKNEWISLIDSDNFADKKYFEIAKKYIDIKIGNKKNIILAPSKALPNFDYSHLNGLIYKKGNFKQNNEFEKINKKSHNTKSIVLMNTGNYIMNKELINQLDLKQEINNINNSPSCDVIYFNTLLFEQMDLNLHVVPNLEYSHVVHDGSIYTQTHNNYIEFNNLVHNRFENLI